MEVEARRGKPEMQYRAAPRKAAVSETALRVIQTGRVCLWGFLDDQVPCVGRLSRPACSAFNAPNPTTRPMMPSDRRVHEGTGRASHRTASDALRELWCSLRQRLLKPPHTLRQGHADSLANVPQLQHVQPPLPGLVLADERLRPAQPPSHVHLLQASLKPHLAQQSRESLTSQSCSVPAHFERHYIIA